MSKIPPGDVKRKARIALIGCGAHANRVYLPALSALVSQGKTELCLIVDLEGNELRIRSLLAHHNLGSEIYCVPPFSGTLPDDIGQELSSLKARLQIDGVVISTEPLVHRCYAEWALNNGLSILLDKPISTRMSVVSSLENAHGIREDYLALLRAYRALQESKETAFTISVQRRYHPGFQFVANLIREVSDKTNCPVTFLHAYHCDGQWRLPSEIVTQDYHPYHSGYGKASHSGYHMFDMMYWLYMASCIRSKAAERMEVVSSFIQPAGFLRQLQEADYFSVFGEDYLRVSKWSDDELRREYLDYGEMDLSAIVTLFNDDVAVANMSVDLLHNGFAQRTWLSPGSDLYKGNGRVKHEHFNIQQGPFQNIQIHSYQSLDTHDSQEVLDDAPGGNNHFDVYVFRNPLVRESGAPMRVYQMKDILNDGAQDQRTHLIAESAKHHVVEEFVGYINGDVPKDTLRSRIEDHYEAVSIMSAIYCSHIQRSRGLSSVVHITNPLAKGPLGAYDQVSLGRITSSCNALQQ